MIESQTGLYVGDRIRLEGAYGDMWDCEVEMFRDCLGVFLTQQHREMGEFTPICTLYGRGCGSEDSYMPNHGEYIKNPVPVWMQLPARAKTD